MTSGWLSGLGLDLRHVVRGLRASRGYTVVAVLSLAMGIGANVAIYGVIRSLLLDRMAVRQPEALAFAYWHQPGPIAVSSMMSSGHQDAASGLQYRSNYSYPMYESIRRQAPGDLHVAGFNFLMTVAVAWGDDPATTIGGMVADGRFFDVVAPRFHLGRPISDADDRPGAPVVAVLSHRYWQRAFGGDSAVVGRQIRVNGVPAEIVGVTAAEYAGLSKGGFFPQTDITLPLSSTPRLMPRWGDGAPLLASNGHLWVRVIARAASGQIEARSEGRLADAIAGQARALRGAEDGPAATRLVDASRGLDQTRPEMRRMLYVLMGVVAVVLLIACVNLAGLMLARGIARQREMAVRRALGAGRSRLVRLLLLEGTVLALAGAVVGLWLTALTSGVLSRALTTGLGSSPFTRIPLSVSLDLRLVGAAFGLSLVATLLFSLLPAARLTRGGHASLLGHVTPGGQRLGRSLVAAQISISVPLLVSAVLLLRTVANLSAVELGFSPEGVSFFRLDIAGTGVADADRPQLYQRVLTAIDDVPGVASATMIENALLSGVTSNNNVTVAGERKALYMNAVGPGFLETMGLRLLAGRAPGVQDRPGAPAVGMLNESAARMMFGRSSPLGKSIQSGRRSVEVIGLVSDARYDSLRSDIRPTLYDSALQRVGVSTHIVVRSARAVESLAPDLKAAVAGISRDIAVPEITTQAAQTRQSMAREEVFAGLLVIFGGFALLLASLGMHGVTAYSVTRRTNEIGVRMALGAQPRQVLWLIQRQVGVLGAAGLLVGLPLSLWTAPLLGTILFGVEPSDGPTISVAGLVMVGVALAAGYLPARRAARLSPVVALRRD